MSHQHYQEIMIPIVQAVERVYQHNLVSCAVFGSYARGVATPESDIDLLIIARDLPRGRMNRVQQFIHVETDPMNVELSPIIKTPAEVEMGSPLFWDMTSDVIILYDENNFFRDYLIRLKQRLDKLGARKVIRGNAWYWILKEDYVPGEVFEL